MTLSHYAKKNINWLHRPDPETQAVNEARKHWFKTYNSPLGNSNYHRVTGTDDNAAHDHATDASYKKKFS